jgi:hypothetical protein
MNSLARTQPIAIAAGPDLEERVRQLELWAVAAHSQIEVMQERSYALTPIVEKLADAAQSQAAIATAIKEEKVERRMRLDIGTKGMSLLVGSASLATFVISLLARKA